MIIKIAACGLIVCLVSLVLRSFAKELIIPLEMLFLCIAGALIFDGIRDKLDSLSALFDGITQGESIFKALIKSAAVCIVCKLACDICNENGNKLTADVIELSGGVVLLVISYPFIEGIINTALAFL